jgi:hypothetical protein
MMETVLYWFLDSMEALYFLFEKVVQGGMLIAFLIFLFKGVTVLSTVSTRIGYDPVSGIGIYGIHPSARKHERGSTLVSLCIFIALMIAIMLIIQMFPGIRIPLAIVGLVATFPAIMLWYAIKMNKTGSETSSEDEPLYHR